MQHRHGEQALDGGGLPVGQRLVETENPGQQGRLGDQTPGEDLDGLGGALQRDICETSSCVAKATMPSP